MGVGRLGLGHCGQREGGAVIGGLRGSNKCLKCGETCWYRNRMKVLLYQKMAALNRCRAGTNVIFFCVVVFVNLRSFFWYVSKVGIQKLADFFMVDKILANSMTPLYIYPILNPSWAHYRPVKIRKTYTYTINTQLFNQSNGWMQVYEILGCWRK